MATLNLFEPLALEILLMIVTRLLDLVSLDSLARASPGIHRLFNDYAVGITEAVLSAGFIHGHIRVIICIIAFIRPSTLPNGIPMPDLDSFTERLESYTPSYETRNLDGERWILECKPSYETCNSVAGRWIRS
jgi:hypothetical protein